MSEGSRTVQVSGRRERMEPSSARAYDGSVEWGSGKQLSPSGQKRECGIAHLKMGAFACNKHSTKAAVYAARYDLPRAPSPIASDFVIAWTVGSIRARSSMPAPCFRPNT